MRQLTIAAVNDKFFRRTVIKRTHRQAAGKGFKRDVAKGFTHTWKQKQIRTGIRRSKRFAAQHAAEKMSRIGRQACTQRATCRAIAYPNHPCVRVSLRDGIKRAHRKRQIFFSGNAANE